MTANRIGFIGGGQMAKALAGGALQKGLVTTEQLLIAEPNALQRKSIEDALGDVEVCEHGSEVLEKCDRIFLAVKPQVLKHIAHELAPKIELRHLLVSIAAGIALPQLQKWFGTERVVRVMPNTLVRWCRRIGDCC